MEKLRFKDFKFVKNGVLSDICEISTGKFNNEKIGNHNVYGANGIIGKTNKISHVGRNIIVGRVGSAGKSMIIDGKYYVSDNAFILKSLQIDYTYAYIEHLKLEQYSFGSVQKLIKSSDLKKIEINIISNEEKVKIGEYFYNLNFLINNKQRQLELMGKYKEDLLDKIFNQKIRFKDENGCDYPEWNTYKITEILKTVSNKKHNRDFDILSVTKDNGIVKRSDNGINIKASEKSIFQYKIVEINDYILHLESFRNGIDKSYIKGVCSPVYTILREKTENILLPILFKYTGFIHRINQLSTGIRQGKNISFSSMENLKINLPIIEEQEKIANLFSNLDLKINVLKNSIKNLKEYKIDMLEKMF